MAKFDITNKHLLKTKPGDKKTGCRLPTKALRLGEPQGYAPPGIYQGKLKSIKWDAKKDDKDARTAPAQFVITGPDDYANIGFKKTFPAPIGKDADEVRNRTGGFLAAMYVSMMSDIGPEMVAKATADDRDLASIETLEGKTCYFVLRDSKYKNRRGQTQVSADIAGFVSKETYEAAPGPSRAPKAEANGASAGAAENEEPEVEPDEASAASESAPEEAEEAPEGADAMPF